MDTLQEKVIPLINLHEQEDGSVAVMGRELHEFLEVKTKYNDWFNRMKEYGFEENADFGAIAQKRVTAQGNTSEYIDHIMTIDMAKEISMIQRNEKGKQARQYFIQIEKAWNSPEMIMKRALQIADRKITDLQHRIEADKPKVVFADAVRGSANSCLVKDLAVLLKQNGINIGQNRLFEYLRNGGYIGKSKSYRNKPNQTSMDRGLLEYREHLHTNSNGELQTKFTPLVTGKGQLYFIGKFLEEAEQPVLIETEKRHEITRR